MAKVKGTSSIEKAHEIRWRLIVRNKKFLKDLQTLNRLLRKCGTLTEEQREKLGDRWGIPRVPWEAITEFDCFGKHPVDDLNDADRIAFLDWSGRHGEPGVVNVSYAPFAVHRVENNRFVFLMADLEHPVDDLVELFKRELQQLRGARSRKRLDKIDEYLQCWDLAKKDMTLSEIAKRVYPENWPELPLIKEDQVREPTPNEIEEKAKELRRKGICAYRWSFKQAREDLLEGIWAKLRAKEKASATQFKKVSRSRQTLRQRVWRNIQSAHRLINGMTRSPPS